MIPTRRAELLAVGAMVVARRGVRAAELRRRASRIAEIGWRRSEPPRCRPKLNNDVIMSAAQRLGVSAEELRNGFVRLRYGDKTVMSQNGAFAFESLTAYLTVNDKRLTSATLAEHGLPVPRFQAFVLDEYHEAKRFFHKLPKPVIVKSNLHTFGGQGVVLDIRAASQFRRAFVTGLVYSNEVLVEEQVSGENYRATVLMASL